jgi:sterol desaturase/sphingolipid hydroxylase (fatty acid hydroxylase superfamily)
MHRETWWYVFAISFVVVALAESFLPARSLPSSTTRRWISNYTLVAVSGAVLLCVYQLTGIALACTLKARSSGLLNRVALPYAVRFVIGFLVLDLTAYISHRFFHAIGPLWRIHSVHHSETDLDLTTGLRFHPLEALLVQGLSLVVIAVLGLPPAAVAVVALVVVVQDFFTHANVRMAPSADRWLRWIIVTPGMHRLHHSEQIAEQNTNFATIFSLWDRVFGTYSPGISSRAPSYGLSEIADGSELNAAGLLLLPFRQRKNSP